MRAAIIAAAGMLVYAGWYARQNAAQGGAVAGSAELGIFPAGAVQSVANFIDYASGGVLKLSNMRQVSVADMTNKNVQAFLRVIRTGEGTSDPDGYRRLFGGQLFDGYADHPRIKVTRGRYTSTAAGAYQALASTWDETRRIMGLRDFSAISQDWFAVGRIAARGALPDVIAGRFDLAIQKIGQEWASMPGSPYGQPVITLARARQVYAANGGMTA